MIVWDVASGAEALRSRDHTGEVTCLDWSADGRRLASGGQDQTVRVTDAATGRTLQTLRGHTAAVCGVAWHPDGARLASAGADRAVRVWDAESGREALTLADHAAQVNAVAWGRDGLALAAATDAGAVVRDAAPGHAAARSAALLPALDRRLAADPADRAARRRRAETHAALGAWVAGPHPPDLDARQPPESLPDPAAPDAGRVWKAVPPNESGFTDFAPLCDHADGVSAYALARVYAPERRGVAALVGSDDQARVWLNGALIYESQVTRAAVPDEDAAPAALEPGWNTLLARVANVTGGHALYLRLSDAPADLARARKADRLKK